MSHNENIDLKILQDNLLDINSKDIPNNVLDKFFDLKNEIGSRPLGIAYYKSKYFFIDTGGTIYKVVSS